MRGAVRLLWPMSLAGLLIALALIQNFANLNQ